MATIIMSRSLLVLARHRPRRRLVGTTTSLSTSSDADRSASVAAYLDLAKAKLSALVVATSAAGFVAAGGPMTEQLPVLASCVLGTALCSSSAAALNQILEVDRDRLMKRTQKRPLVDGSLTKGQATTAAGLWGAAGGGLLWMGTDPVTTALGVGNIALYAGLYTWLKPRSIYNTWVGAVVGAVPPVMGWTAATGGAICDIEALWLGTTLYLWQMPHFFALSFMHRVDYKRGGFCMVPVEEEDGVETARLVVRYAWMLSSMPILATITGLTSSMFALEGVAMNAYALTVAHRFQRDRTNGHARQVFLTSLWYLPSMLMLFLLHSKVWDEDKMESDRITKFLSDQIHRVRETGKEYCLHEAAAARGEEASCPVTMSAETSRQGAEAVANLSSALQDEKEV